MTFDDQVGNRFVMEAWIFTKKPLFESLFPHPPDSSDQSFLLTTKLLSIAAGGARAAERQRHRPHLLDRPAGYKPLLPLLHRLTNPIDHAVELRQLTLLAQHFPHFLTGSGFLERHDLD